MVKIIPVDTNVISEDSNRVNKCCKCYEDLNDKNKCTLLFGLIVFTFLLIGLFLLYFFNLKK